MNIDLKPGCYVVAVSGGVDSVVLLDLLVKKYESSVVSRQSSDITTNNKQRLADDIMKQYKFIVAHFDHGIRPDSSKDRKFVQTVAQKYNLPFVYERENLGAKASEALARAARYNFLRRSKTAARARAIITAHHQDDMIETALLNLMRGTGRKGLTSLRSRNDLLRPLLSTTKQKLLTYAKAHDLAWREDSTNQDMRYKRNYVRHQLKPKLKAHEYEQFVTTISNLSLLNDEIDTLVTAWLSQQPGDSELSRHQFIMLPHAVCREIMAAWLGGVTTSSFSKDALERVSIAAKTLRPGKSLVINKYWQLIVTQKSLALTYHDR